MQNTYGELMKERLFVNSVYKNIQKFLYRVKYLSIKRYTLQSNEISHRNIHLRCHLIYGHKIYCTEYKTILGLN